MSQFFDEEEDAMLVEAWERMEEEEFIMGIMPYLEEEERQTSSPQSEMGMEGFSSEDEGDLGAVSEDDLITIRFFHHPVLRFDKLQEIDADFMFFEGERNVSLAYCVTEEHLLEEEKIDVGQVVVQAGQEGTFVFKLIIRKMRTQTAKYADLQRCLLSLRSHLRDRGVRMVVTPKLGCGRYDDLYWGIVRQIIQSIFQEEQVQFMVFTRE